MTETVRTGPAKFGRLAYLYRWIEYFSFGPYLKQCRELCISDISGHARTLIYGDGDGRFLAKLVRCAPRMRIVAIDASGAMLRRAASRLPAGARVRLLESDALTCEPKAFAEAPFDLVVSHFFLDCFREGDLMSLMERVREATTPGAVWVVSDFAIPHRPVLRTLGRGIIQGLYLVFGLLTGLKTRCLPDHAAVMRRAGWTLEDHRELLLGLLISQRWRRMHEDDARFPVYDSDCETAEQRVSAVDTPTNMATSHASVSEVLRAGSIPGSPPDVFPDPFPPPSPEPDGPGFPDPDPDPAPLDPVPNPAPVN